MSLATALDEMVEELRRADKLLLTTHENPDGDALGSLLAMHEILTALGKDSIMFMADPSGLPYEYRQMPFEGLRHTPPSDLEQRIVVFLDCGNIDRVPIELVQRNGRCILNVDHHHDNTRFGTVNLVLPAASSTAEIVFNLAKELGVELTPRIADALYVGLVTDTGRFMYESTTPDAHRMAAELIEAGVAAHEVNRRLYEQLPFGRLQLLARALARVERYDGGLLTVTHLTRADFEATATTEADTEGVVDRVRAVEGTAVAALIRELRARDRQGERKVSLRATDQRVDVSLIARRHGGGGHRQAAGFSTHEPLPELIEALRADVREQL